MYTADQKRLMQRAVADACLAPLAMRISEYLIGQLGDGAEVEMTLAGLAKAIGSSPLGVRTALEQLEGARTWGRTRGAPAVSRYRWIGDLSAPGARPERWVRRPAEVMLSPAWRALAVSDRRVLDALELANAEHDGQTNGQLEIGYAGFARDGILHVPVALRRLTALGLIEVTKRAEPRAASRYRSQANWYRLTYLPSLQGEATDEWRQIKTNADAEQAVKAAEARSDIVAYAASRVGDLTDVLIASGGDDGRAHWPDERLGARLGVSRKTLQHWRRELVDAGWEIVSGSGPRCTTYRPPPPAEPRA
jgi:hypothetical protein